MVVTADRQMEYGGLLLADPFHIQNVEGLLGKPEVRSGSRPRVVRHGSIAGRSYYGDRVVTITVDLTAFDEGTFATAVESLQAAFAGLDEAPLTFRIPGVAGGNTARVYVAPRHMALPIPHEYYDHTAEATIELVASDPFIYSEVLTTHTVGMANAQPGFSFPLNFPFNFGGTAGSGSVSMFNAGNTTAFPTVRIFGPVFNPRIRNETTDQEISFIIGLNAGEFLEVDMANGIVLFNGEPAANRYYTLDSREFWGLVPGVNTIRYTAPAISASSAEVSYRSAWV